MIVYLKDIILTESYKNRSAELMELMAYLDILTKMMITLNEKCRKSIQDKYKLNIYFIVKDNKFDNDSQKYNEYLEKLNDLKLFQFFDIMLYIRRLEFTSIAMQSAIPRFNLVITNVLHVTKMDLHTENPQKIQMQKYNNRQISVPVKSKFTLPQLRHKKTALHLPSLKQPSNQLRIDIINPGDQRRTQNTPIPTHNAQMQPQILQHSSLLNDPKSHNDFKKIKKHILRSISDLEETIKIKYDHCIVNYARRIT